MGLRQITAPAAEVISLADAKFQCTEAGTAFDTLFGIWIAAARDQLEERVEKAMLTQTLLLTLDCFPCGVIYLPRPPLQSVVFVKYLDSDGVVRTMPPESYQVVVDVPRPYVIPTYGNIWPACRIQPASIQVQYVAGYTDVSLIPPRYKQWMLLAIATWYSQREAVSGNPLSALPDHFCDGLLDVRPLK